MPISDTPTPGATSSKTRGETLHVLKRMAVPDKEALASVRSEVEVHVSYYNFDLYSSRSDRRLYRRNHCDLTQT